MLTDGGGVGMRIGVGDVVRGRSGTILVGCTCGEISRLKPLAVGSRCRVRRLIVGFNKS
jgi:hypothetical protein